ncbi:uncharacterized protein A1O9_12409 [Exophiala aquamarina CBS 119918]|uniref:Mitochondrial chaperone BCS1 n=1 Tax=Exophiala aquamarina CBS 119918 TaxID=1182545 RepID=A0A072NVR6_9EURO|nr:uncharacterized protein A1O9_12409 [Exophiala aquamarina CBS 119918]KEF51492.1 hypothetical protein A1O9_12409 [Exophiala aquamarina CBS 119918]
MDPTASLHLPATLIDTFIPGYSFFAQVLLSLGVDISIIVSFAVFTVCAWTAVRYAFSPVFSFLLDAISSSVTVDQFDPIFNDMLNWVSEYKHFQDIRVLRAHSPRQYHDDLDEVNLGDESQLRIHEQMSEDIIFNFNDWAARAPPKFQPHQSSGFFWHKRRVFRITRSRERVASDWGPALYEREWMNILVLSLTAQPVKDLIEEAREFHLRQRTSTTSIQRPTPKAQRGRRNVWTIVATRPSRSMATVVLGNDQKATVLKDINDFLHPRTARWYSNRGIPYRRGYLFHGPPGTGKTSLSFAIAGVFGLDIYCLALSEVSLTEEDLILLFNSLPKRCILLLEDIDSAGVAGRPQLESDQETKKNPHSEEFGKGSDPQAGKRQKNLKRAERSKINDMNPDAPPKTNTITLSGLLNAIDGVASQEGRILILTTNHPDRLNEALIRPGRVDLQIKFDLANMQQIKDLFLRMYYKDPVDIARQPTRISQILPDQTESIKQTRDAPVSISTASLTTTSSDSLAPSSTSWSEIKPQAKASEREPQASDDLPSQRKELENMALLADAFTEALPELTFSPAEIQGFLLMRKNRPQQAVLEVTAWRDAELAKKRRGQGVSTSLQETAGTSEPITEQVDGANAESPMISSTRLSKGRATSEATEPNVNEQINPSSDSQQQNQSTGAFKLSSATPSIRLPAEEDHHTPNNKSSAPHQQIESFSPHAAAAAAAAGHSKRKQSDASNQRSADDLGSQGHSHDAETPAKPSPNASAGNALKMRGDGGSASGNGSGSGNRSSSSSSSDSGDSDGDGDENDSPIDRLMDSESDDASRFSPLAHIRLRW